MKYLALPDADILRRYFRYEESSASLYFIGHPVQKTKNGKIAQSPHKSGYKRTSFMNAVYYTHKIIYVLHNGNIPDGMEIDHANGDHTDNRVENLRLCTRSQNTANSRSKSSSGYRGVYCVKGRWKAIIRVGGAKKGLGTFDTPLDASNAYITAAKEAYGDFARRS